MSSTVSAKVLVDYSKYKHLLESAQDTETDQDPSKHNYDADSESEASNDSTLNKGEESSPHHNFTSEEHDMSSKSESGHAERMERQLLENKETLQDQKMLAAKTSDLTPNIPTVSPSEVPSDSVHKSSKKRKKTKPSSSSMTSTKPNWWKLGSNSKHAKKKKK